MSVRVSPAASAVRAPWTLLFAGLIACCASSAASGEGEKTKEQKIRVYSVETKACIMADKVDKTEQEWKAQLTPLQYDVTRRKGTERAFTGEYWNHHGVGVYKCVACGNDLFASDTKFDSGTGWPSFYAPVAGENVATESDRTLVMVRTEVRCSRCGAHLGHVFDDGPKPSGLRYCINSASLNFEAKR